VDHVDAKKALKGQLAILVIVASGGDFTSDGQFASPVQISFLFDGEKILGKLPEFQMRSQLKTMLGDDYIGTFDTPFYFGDHERIQGYYMDIVR
jgi:PmbA protein